LTVASPGIKGNLSMTDATKLTESEIESNLEIIEGQTLRSNHVEAMERVVSQFPSTTLALKAMIAYLCSIDAMGEAELLESTLERMARIEAETM
jgi:hypothetical protein